MLDLKNIARAVQQVAEEKGIDPLKVMDAIESAIAAAYKKEYEKRGEIIKSKLDLKTGALKFWQVKTVVDPTTVDLSKDENDAEPVNEPSYAPPSQNASSGRSQAMAGEPSYAPPSQNASSGRSQAMAGEPSYAKAMAGEEEKLPKYNSDRHILIEDAQKIKPGAVLGEELEFALEMHDDFGRIAAQTAKQVVLQRLREAERESVRAEYQNREGEIVSGSVQRIERGNVYIDLGRAVGLMFYSEAIPGEHYRVGERLRFLVLAVQDDARSPGILLSRAHPKFIQKLFSIEVPEIADGSVEIKAIAREPGSRTKIAVVSKAPGIDPVGSCVGQRGTRVMALSNELGQEKIDIIEWTENQAQFIANALSPAKVASVELLDHHETRVYVPDDQLSLAIGKGGQNVRLAAKLSGWKIDVRSQTRPEEVQQEGIAEGDVPEEQTDQKEIKKDVE